MAVLPLVASVTHNANGSITLNFEGLPNTTTRIWATTNLALPDLWQPIFTNTTTTTNGTWQFTDTSAIHLPERYYYFTTPEGKKRHPAFLRLLAKIIAPQPPGDSGSVVKT
jgi:hypothetical protein